MFVLFYKIKTENDKTLNDARFNEIDKLINLRRVTEFDVTSHIRDW